MNDDRIAQLLQQVDRANVPTIQSGLARQVLRRHMHRRRTRMAGAIAAITLLATVGVYVALRSPPPQTIAQRPGSEPQARQAMLASLEAEAQLHALVAERMWAVETSARQSQRAERALPSMNPLDVILQQRERAALILVDQADRRLRRNKQDQAAAQEYRQTIALFPQTHGAALARQRLEQIGHGKEG